MNRTFRIHDVGLPKSAQYQSPMALKLVRSDGKYQKMTVGNDKVTTGELLRFECKTAENRE